MADQEEKVKRICYEVKVSREEALYYLEEYHWDLASAMEACRIKHLPPIKVKSSPEASKSTAVKYSATPVARYPPKDLSLEVKKERIDAFREVAYGNGMTLAQIEKFLIRFDWNVAVAVNHFLEERNHQYIVEEDDDDDDSRQSCSAINKSNLHRKGYIPMIRVSNSREGQIGSCSSFMDIDAGGKHIPEAPMPSSQLVKFLELEVSEVPQLPKDIIESLLVLVPLKSLIRCSVVSKLWHSIVQHSEFIHSHFSHTRPMFLHAKEDEAWMLEVDTPTYFNYTVIKTLKKWIFRSVSQCDGLILSSTSPLNRISHPPVRLLLWNSFEENHRVIRTADLTTFDNYCLGKNKSMRYKILRFHFGSFELRSDSHEPVCELYDLDSNTWTSIQMEVGWDLDRYRFRVVSMGNFSFWLAVKENPTETFVQSFNFETESFHPLHLPSLGVERNVTLSTYRGEDLLLLNHQPWEDMKSDIWVRNTSAEVWEKMFSIGAVGHLSWKFPSFFLHKEELLVLSEELVNAADASIRLTEIAKSRVTKTTQVAQYANVKHSTTCIYQPSLVPVPRKKDRMLRRMMTDDMILRRSRIV